MNHGSQDIQQEGRQSQDGSKTQGGAKEFGACQSRAMVEEWRPISGFEGQYEVSNIGRVRSMDRYVLMNIANIKPYMMRIRGKLMRQFLHNEGYLYLTLSSLNKKTKCLVARLVALAFIARIDGKPTVNHINAIKTDNRVENLEWASHVDQMKHAAMNGLTKHGFPKLSTQDVETIRKSKATSKMLSAGFGVTTQTIRAIRNGRERAIT